MLEPVDSQLAADLVEPRIAAAAVELVDKLYLIAGRVCGLISAASLDEAVLVIPRQWPRPSER
ncbi:hypothetical protein ACWDO0_28205 [Nocardia rhamnosiphila]